MQKKYKLYEVPFDCLPKRPRAVYSHYENGRMLILSPHKKNADWKTLTPEDIKNLTEHEKQWYARSRNEINAEYLKTPEAQSQTMAYTDRLLEIFEENLKQIQKSMIEENNAENESNRNGE